MSNKALILALLIGAFSLPHHVNAQATAPDLTLLCEPGDTILRTLGACGQSAPERGCEVKYAGPDYFGNKSTLSTKMSDYHEWLAAKSTYNVVSSTCTVTDTSYTASWSPTKDCSKDNTTYQYAAVTRTTAVKYKTGSNSENCPTAPISNSSSTVNKVGQVTIKLTDEITCPEDYPEGPQLYDDGEIIGNFCYYIPVVPDCNLDDSCPPDEPPPTCDDITGNCEPDPQCFRTGSGSQVCFEDPDEKCDKSDSATIGPDGQPIPVYANCASGCGFINDRFMCADEPDLPSLDDCLVTTNGYACPGEIPEPDDDIADPNKANSDMVKGDYKDVLRGVETRTDATNKLLSDQIARDKENTDLIAGGLGKANGYLAEIDKNTKAIRDGLDDLQGDGESTDFGNTAQYKSEISGMLGITGDESIEDLTVAEIGLDDFKDDFNWSIGTSQCPQPRQINMLGKTFYMEWEPFCQAFTVMGYLILAAAYFMATMIAFKGN